jgi:2-dehydro-3-deoxyphosphogluconate aldolase / (4S)-4-hydroxy-2-oxoglutarate aldolase
MSAASGAARLERERLLAIVRADSADDARRAATTLLAGGLRAIEISLVTPGAERAIAALAAEAPPDALIGAGTVRSLADAERAAEAGAALLVSPLVDATVVAWAREHDLLHLPGAFTPTELSVALDAGAALVKLFPARTGGPRHVRDLLVPFPEARLVPTGGVTPDDAAAYLAAGAVAVAIGGALAGDATARDPDRLHALLRSLRATIPTLPTTA